MESRVYTLKPNGIVLPQSLNPCSNGIACIHPWIKLHSSFFCLNPCSNGIACILIYGQSDVYGASLNPCSNGIACIHMQKYLPLSEMCLNPCSNGIACIL